MRRAAALVTFASIATAIGCGPEFAVQPPGGLAQTQVTTTGVTVTAFSEQWESSPYDLADYVTPIAVDLFNAGPNEVRVAFADFQLRDERGTRYTAINPFTPLSPQLGVLDPLSLHGENARLFAGPFMATAHSGGGHGGSGHFGGPRFTARPGAVVGPTQGRRPSSGFLPGPGPSWAGYQISGGLRGYYGPGAVYFPGSFGYPSYAGDWVAPWGERFYPATQPSEDVLALALPEGVLPPGAHVNGFLYFKNATVPGARRLDLAWELHDAMSGDLVGLVHVPLDVVRR